MRKRLISIFLAVCVIAGMFPGAFADGAGIRGIKIGDVGVEEIEDLVKDVFSSDEIRSIIAYIKSLGDDIYTTLTDEYEEFSREIAESTDEMIAEIIREELAKCNVTLSDENVAKVVSLVRRIASLDKETFTKRVEAAKKLIEKLSKLTDKIDTASEKVSGFMEPVKNFFGNLFGSFS